MLKKITEGRVESDEGFFIQVAGPETLKYSERNRAVLFDCTVNSQTNKISIYVSDYETWDIPDKNPITQDEKEKIKNNISRAVELLDGDFTII